VKLNIGGEAGGPLAGIRVIDLSTVVSGPVCAQVLGDLGADVVKVETRIGDIGRYLGGLRKADMTGFFAQFNRNKRSAVLDLKTEQGAAALRALAKTADVLVENFRPGVMDRLGLGEATLRAENPRLIYVAISGFGPEGPYAKRPAYDMVIQALSGFSKLLGSDEQPKLISNLVADKTSGITAAWATLAALFAREREGGAGQRVDVPMLDAFASFVLPDPFGPRVFGEPPESAAAGDGLYRAWPTKDGHVAGHLPGDRAGGSGPGSPLREPAGSHAECGGALRVPGGSAGRLPHRPAGGTG
jgi:crotonobetainyl-CoA:carnitine CoA-transferase CaiB-like acyl-CoA transferase